ncbi:MAG: hypothetical protein JSS65_04570 [Armatimonadetes bacterium]|nr:hypothetical protein [Armatimonadota bacterium]
MAMTPERELALGLAEGRAATPKEIARVAEEVGDEAARWAFTQWALRERGCAKFGRARQMLFTREGLEMATHERVAAFHAELLTDEGCPIPLGSGLLDATCGIGADTVALARQGQTTACDLDPEHAALTLHNLAVHGLLADVQVTDCLTLDWSDKAVFVDPQRRTGRGRTLDPQSFSPPFDAVVAKCRTARRAVVKMSPMLPDEVLEQGDGLDFVSHGGECCEALMLFGFSHGRRAYQVETESWIDASPLASTLDDPLGYVFEADPAAIRTHALGEFGLAGLGDSNGYLTGFEPVGSPWLASFRVLWHGAFREDKIREATRELGLVVRAVKKRGVDIDPEKLRKKLAGQGKRPAVAILYKVGKSVRAVLAERIP